MGNMISILIADDNEEFGNMLSDYLSQEPDFSIKGIARDGIQALDMIDIHNPDAVILDIIMPNLDGIGVLERMSKKKMEHKPVFIVLSAIGQDIFIQKAISIGAEYYIVKPFSADVLVTRIRQVVQESNLSAISKYSSFTRTIKIGDNMKGQSFPNSVEIEITNLMHDVGIPPHMLGYQYIREAIALAINDKKYSSSVTKYLYPAVAEKYQTLPQRVERAIRNAIDSAWSRGNPDSVDSLFGYSLRFSRGKPTNAEFIAMLVDKIRLSVGITPF